eukprot:3467485-Alexandrium_andersonii.AAC.1
MSAGSLRGFALPDPRSAGGLRLGVGPRPRLRCVPGQSGACDWLSTDACSLRACTRSCNILAACLSAAPS